MIPPAFSLVPSCRPASMGTERPSRESAVEKRMEACLREVSAFLDAVEGMGSAQWHALHDRFEELGPAKARKLSATINSDWLHLASWPEVKTIPEETALRDAMRSHWPRLGDAIQKARMQFMVDPAVGGLLNRATDAKVKTIWFRANLESTEQGRRALALVATLFDGLLPDVEETRRSGAEDAAAQRLPVERAAAPIVRSTRVRTAPRSAAERMPALDAEPPRVHTFDEALALRTAKIRHPVSPSYSVLLALSERIFSLAGQRLTHGERLFATLFDEMNAEWENGGLEQYLTNASGATAEHARAYLAEIGAWGVLAILDEAAWRFYDGSIPRAESARNRRLENVLMSDDDANRWLDMADRRWRSVQAELYDRLVDYAAAHRADFARP